MSPRYYAIVWINHNAAEVFRINAIEESKRVVNSLTSLQSLHHRGHVEGSEHHPVDMEYFARIASALNHVGGTLLAGPGEARFELGRYLGQSRPDLAVAAVVTIERPFRIAAKGLARIVRRGVLHLLAPEVDGHGGVWPALGAPSTSCSYPRSGSESTMWHHPAGNLGRGRSRRRWQPGDARAPNRSCADAGHYRHRGSSARAGSPGSGHRGPIPCRSAWSPDRSPGPTVRRRPSSRDSHNTQVASFILT